MLNSNLYVPGELLIKSNRRLDARAAAHLRELGVSGVKRFDAPPSMAKAIGGDLYRVELADGVGVEDAMRRLRAERGVAWAEPNWRVRSFDRPAAREADPQAWGLNAIHAPEAWQVTTGGGPLVAIIDTGMDYGHPALAPNVHVNAGEVPGDGIDNDGNGVVDDVHGADFAYDDGDPMDGRGHGTHVAGTIGGSGVGVNWRADLMPVKFLDDGGFGDTADAIEALMYAERQGARITSNSWGGINYSQALYETLRASHALHVCAAGNDGSDNDVAPAYPASYDLDNVVAVSATQRDDSLASFSNYGANSVDLAAPGHEIWSTLPGGGYGTKSGTSMAAPHVTGVAALVLAQFPDLTNAELKERLIDSCDAVPALDGKSVSGGRLNAAVALSDDVVAPAAIGDFSATAVGSDGVRLQWTATGDDAAVGTAARYELRVAERPIVAGAAREGEISWDDARPVRSGRPSPAGAAEQAVVDVLPSGESHDVFFALIARDKVGNASPMAMASATVPGTPTPFRDDFENGLGQWTATGTWGIGVENGNRIVMDSPSGDYPSNVDTTLTSRPIDLSGLQHPQLRYKTRFKIENSFDRLALEISTDNGANWQEIDLLSGRDAAGTGNSKGWTQRACDLSAYAGQTVQVRMHLRSDADIEMDGVALDDFVVGEHLV